MYIETREVTTDERKTIGQLRAAVPTVDHQPSGVTGCRGIVTGLLLGALLIGCVGLLVLSRVF